MVLFKTDAEKGEGIELAKEYLVQGYPTFVLTNAKGEALDTWSGYGKEHFLETIGTAVADPTTIAEKTARFGKSPSAADAKKLARFHGTRGEYVDAVRFAKKAGEIAPSAENRYDEFYYTAYASIRGSEDFSLEDVTAAADQVVRAKDVSGDTLVELADMMSYLGQKNEQPRLVVPYLEPALKATKGTTDPGLAQARQGIEIEHALLVLNDKDKALELKRASMPEGWKDDASGLNSFAWWCFEKDVNLEEAEALARHGVEVAAAGREKAMILDTAAEICNARGNCDDAVELIQRAVSEDPDSEHYQKQLTRFQEIRAAKAN
ncbi:MAG: hypothetical protein R3B81_19100 [bacterium]